MNAEEAIEWAKAHGAADEQLFAFAVGCASHGQGYMDFTEDASESFCHACECAR